MSTYGLTETCGGIAYDGRLFDDTSARIDATGGVQIHGPTLMEGYRHDPAATAVAFTLDGWLRTGDTGALESDGRLRIDGRSDEAIRTGAETVWPHEVEDALREHPKVAEIAVAGRPHRGVGAAGRSVRRARERRRSPHPGGAAAARCGADRAVQAPPSRRLDDGAPSHGVRQGPARSAPAVSVTGETKARAREGWARASDLVGITEGVVIPRCGYRCRGVRIRVFGTSSGKS